MLQNKGRKSIQHFISKTSSTRGGKVNHTSAVIKKGQSDNVSLKWVWIREDKAHVVFEFTGSPGVAIVLPPDPNGLELFKHFVTDELTEIIVGKINVYASQYIRDHPDLANVH